MARNRDLAGQIEQFLNGGADPAPAEVAWLRRFRLTQLVSLGLILIGVPEGFLVWHMGERLFGAGVLAAMLLHGVNLWWLRRRRNLDLAANVTCCIVYAALVFSIAELGGLRSTAFAWLFLLPVVAGVLSGTGSTVLWTVVSVWTAVAFWVLEVSAFDSHEVLPVTAASLRVLIDRVSEAGAAGLLTWVFLYGQRQAEDELQRTNSAMGRESRSLELLRSVAAAANAATSVEAALRICVREVCRFTGWPVGHAHLLSEDGCLRPSELWSLEEPARFEALVQATRRTRFAPGEGLPGRVLASGQPEWIEDLAADPALLPGGSGELPVRSALGLPVVADGEVVAVLEFFSPEPQPRNEALVDLLAPVGTQVGRVFERERAASRIRNLAYYDGLTQLPNRRLFQESLELALRRARRDGRVLALLFIDLDGFKDVNDSLGHEAGDRLLCEVAQRLRRTVRLSDVVARGPGGEEELGHISRLGGDEFTILLPQVERPQDAALVAQRALAALEQPIELSGERIFVSASIGIALHPHDADDAGTLLREADTAMYAAKQDGGGHRFFDEVMNRESVQRIEMGAMLREALDRGRFELHFQPICDAHSGAVQSAEALIRMRDPAGHLVPPDRFIPVAEEIGLIGPIGEWVLRTACREAVEWREDFGHPLRVAVNVSVQQIRVDGFVDAVERVLRETGLPASALELEITESTIMRDDAPTREAVRRLTELGLGLTLDDFGTGYSSLSYLRRFPLSRIKIDRSFISDIPGNEADVTLTSAILALGTSLGLRVVAEGVETEEQLAFLRSRGCSEVQGYLMSRPLPARDFADFLRKCHGL